MGAGRRDREHGLRHGRGGEGRAGHLGDRGPRPAQRRPGQPAGRRPSAARTGCTGRPRCRRDALPSARCRPPSAGAARGRAAGTAMGWPRPSPCSVPATAARGSAWSCRTSSSRTAPWSDRSPGRSRCAGWRPGTTCSSSRWSIRASSRCPMWVRWSWSTPRAVTGARSGPPSPGCGSSTRASRRTTAPPSRRRCAPAGAQHVVLRTDRDWIVDLARFVGSRRRRRHGGHRPGVPR